MVSCSQSFRLSLLTDASWLAQEELPNREAAHKQTALVRCVLLGAGMEADSMFMQGAKEDKQLLAQHASDLEQARGSSCHATALH